MDRILCSDIYLLLFVQDTIPTGKKKYVYIMDCWAKNTYVYAGVGKEGAIVNYPWLGRNNAERLGLGTTGLYA